MHVRRGRKGRKKPTPDLSNIKYGPHERNVRDERTRPRTSQGQGWIAPTPRGVRADGSTDDQDSRRPDAELFVLQRLTMNSRVLSSAQSSSRRPNKGVLAAARSAVALASSSS